MNLLKEFIASGLPFFISGMAVGVMLMAVATRQGTPKAEDRGWKRGFKTGYHQGYRMGLQIVAEIDNTPAEGQRK